MPSFKDAIHNKSGLSIDIRFDLKPLVQALEKAPDDFFFQQELEPYFLRAVAKGAKAKIKKGKAGRQLKPSTKEIRIKRGQQPGPPLLASGKLFKSIEARKDGLYAVDYAQHHLGTKDKPHAYTVKKQSSEFTRYWKKDHKVPKRNFLPTKEKLDIGKGQKLLVNKINRLIKRK